MRASIRWLVVVSTIALTAAPLGAQRSVLLVGVGDAESGVFVPHAEVTVYPERLKARTDSLGQARIAGLMPGKHAVEVRRIGYAPLGAPVMLSGRDSVEVVLMVRSSAATLPTVSVVDTAAPFFLREFEERRRTRTGGKFITTEQIDRVRDYDLGSLFIAHIPGLRLDGEGKPLSSRGRCRPLTFWNGVKINLNGGGLGDLLKTQDLGGVEFYPPGFVPVQYHKPGDMAVYSGGNPLLGGAGRARAFLSRSADASCGVLLLWSRP